MAHSVAIADGNLNAASTWSGGVIPGDGDTFESSDYLVTFTASVTIGDAPDPAADVIDLSVGAGMGRIRILDGVTLTVKGSINGTWRNVITEAGGHLRFDVGTGLVYKLRTAQTWGDTGGLVCNGVLGNRATISKIGLGTAWLEISEDSMGGKINCSHTDFRNLGDESTYAIQFRLETLLDHCTFDGCSVGYHNGYSQEDFILSNCAWKNSVGPLNLNIRWEWENLAERSIRRCSFDKSGDLLEADDLIIEDCFEAEQWTTGAPGTPVATYQNNFLVGNGVVLASKEIPVIRDCFFYTDEGENPHYMTSTVSLAAQRITGCIVECGSDWVVDSGEFITLSEASVPTVLTVDHCIILRNANGLNSGNLHAQMGNSNTTVIGYNNTYPGISSPHIAETYAGHVGALQEIKNNLAYGNGVETGSYVLLFIGPSYAEDYVTNCHHNAGYQVTSQYNDIPADAFANTPGTGDVTDQDPQFVDETRDLASWAAYALGATGTDVQKRQAALDRFADMDTNPESPSDCMAWIKEGFTPTNMSLATSGDGGTYMGAILPIAAGWSGIIAGIDSSSLSSIGGLSLSDISSIGGL